MSQKIEASISEKRTVKDENGKKVPHPHAGESASVDYDFGGDLEGLVALIESSGKPTEEAEKIVYSNAVANMVTTFQSGIRLQIEKGSTPDEIQSWADNRIPGFASGGARKPLDEKVGKLAEKADIDDINETIAMLEELKAKRQVA